MTTASDLPAAKASLPRRIWGSVLSIFVGWLTLNLVLIVVSIAVNAEWKSALGDWLQTALAEMLISGMVTGIVWLVALLPLYVFVPLRFWLWRWYVCTPCGALAGAGIMLWYLHFRTWVWDDLLVAVALGAIPGGVTCLFGSLTAGRFHQPPARPVRLRS
ncbi:hypothetical protein CfE428DRAFT_3656 [Chthoniobacter flavus Ellin428]|uniref:Uncharacterized protein n=1 Tax=Chthoniobacter flavus Ellin428 TaxID=497964 RepID=B4D418_9BACT|nr:hypothetical protein [Chthoniobacter flavus]EDY18998.1 hypothetical protein CfE428DRAFT_3656 [Chthoniobacter flavus Ellin428]TCO93579.1 hypothetical protein EV701_104283 [Chthoniobacter flavus]